MRPSGRGELDSLYFDYPRFDAPEKSVRDQVTKAPVAIAGAGPVGLVAALTLARDGVRSVVFEAKDTFNDGSRAICVARHSFHILERIGAVAPFLDKALGWTTGRSFFRGRQILEFHMPHDDDQKFWPMYNLQQQYIEQYLWEAAERSDLIEIRWQSAVIGVTDTEDGLRLTVEDPSGAYDFDADWLLAADGARSAIRKMRGLKLSGENYEGRYVIADVRMDHDYPTIRRALFDPKANPGGTVLIHRQPGDIWRIDYQLEPGESADEATREAVVRQKVAAILAELGHDGEWELEWWSVYSANTLALPDYRDGRIFFIGDSAHIVPIFGVRGLNNGLADGENIGWKLARVVKGEASDALLDTYTPERRGATLDVFANATKSTRFMTPPTRGWQLMRDAALSLSLSHDFARSFANPRQMAPYTYAESPLTAADGGGRAAPGTVTPNVRLSDATWLSDHLGTGFTLILFGDIEEAQLERLLQAGREHDPAFKVIDIGDVEGHVAQRFLMRGGEAVLVRPDMYIAKCFDRADPAAVAGSIANMLKGERP